MKTRLGFRSKNASMSHIEVFDWLSWNLSIYLIPLLIVLASVAALFMWNDQYATTGFKTIPFKVVTDSQAAFSPAEAEARLKPLAEVAFVDTHLAESPVWFAFKIPAAPPGAEMVALPSRHMMDVACWNAVSLSSLGQSSRAQSSGAIEAVKAGFAIRLDGVAREVLCRARFIGPARLSAELWPTDQLMISAHDFHRRSGLLDGGLIVLAVFVLITAAINRQALYVLFSAWLIANLRVGAISSGWDIQWLGSMVPPEWLPLSRSITVAVYAILTLTLFLKLFEDDLLHTAFNRPLKITQWLCVPVLVCAVALSPRHFLPLMWVMAGIGLVLMTFSLASIVRKTRSRVGLWYGAALAVTFLATLIEIVAAAYGKKALLGAVNSVTAALSSSLLASLAIAEQMRLEHLERLEIQAEMQHTYEVMPIGLFSLDTEGRFLGANPAFHRMLGTHPATIEKSNWNHYFADSAWTRLHNLVCTHPDGELEVRRKPRPAISSSSAGGLSALGPASGADGDAQRFMVKATLARNKIEGSMQDVTTASRATEELHFLANHDPLTQVFNRRGIERVLRTGIDHLTEAKPLAVAYLDLDRFKLINDLFGHASGDTLLKQVCDRINKLLSGAQKLGRVGGDEFLIILPETPITLATLICNGIVSSIANDAFRVGDKAFHVRVSIGLLDVSAGTDIKDIISTADRACREAKAGRSEGLVVYEKNARAFGERQDELVMVELLSSPQATDTLFLDMQPIMSLSTPHQSLNFEVLLRMRGKDGAVIPAGKIIAAGENSGQMGVIDRWVLSTTLAWLRTHQAALKKTQFVCMNLSGASLNDQQFMEDVFRMLKENQSVAHYLCMEVTESVALHDLDNTRQFIDRVRSYGVKVALDDFGAGYTSFSYLKELPADLLKIDGSFIVNMNAHPANIAIVEAIVSLAKNLGMKIIAEWAEDFETVQTLAEIGVDYVQGYAVARPQTPEKLLAADSGASFITDPVLMEYVNLLDAGSGPASIDKLLELGAAEKFH